MGVAYPFGRLEGCAEQRCKNLKDTEFCSSACKEGLGASHGPTKKNCKFTSMHTKLQIKNTREKNTNCQWHLLITQSHSVSPLVTATMSFLWNVHKLRCFAALPPGEYRSQQKVCEALDRSLNDLLEKVL